MKLWQLEESNARLTVDSLQARVDLRNPALGIHDLAWNSAPVHGNLFGVTVAEESAPPMPLSNEGIDCFVRGNDLVANYPQCGAQRFTLQMYWRVVASSASAIVIDSIVSLQTSLLECFPKALLTTNLPAGEVMALLNDGTPSVTVGDRLASDEPAGVLVRDDNQPWSYLEMTHPTDLGCWRVSRADGVRMVRELGGEFQEKGVIRRLRVRSVFMARENDEKTAARLIAEFAASEPPLTA
jgi:hypothetical protein